MELDEVVEPRLPQQAPWPQRERLPGELEQSRHDPVPDEGGERVGHEHEGPDRDALARERTKGEARVPRTGEVDARPGPGQADSESVGSYPAAVSERQDGKRRDAENPHLGVRRWVDSSSIARRLIRAFGIGVEVELHVRRSLAQQRPDECPQL